VESYEQLRNIEHNLETIESHLDSLNDKVRETEVAYKLMERAVFWGVVKGVGFILIVLFVWRKYIFD